MEELARCTPSYAGITFERLETRGIQWPCPSLDHPGTPFLHKDNFARGKGRFHGVHHIPAAEEPDQEYPLLLTTGRNLYQFHTGSMSRRSKLERLRPEELMMIHPDTARDYQMVDGDYAQVESRRGEVTTKIQVTDHIQPGVVFLTFHYKETPTNRLTNSARDPVCQIPELKVCAVKVKKVT